MNTCRAIVAVLAVLLLNGHTKAVGDEEIMQAALRGDVDKARECLTSGANINARNQSDKAPLHCAAGRNREQMVEFLLEQGAQVDMKDEYGFTPLHCAASRGYVRIVKLLLEKGAMSDARSKIGDTPLHLVARNGQEGVIPILLENGALVDAKNDEGAKTPLILAIQGLFTKRENRIEAVKALLEGGADVGAVNRNGWTALHWEVAGWEHEEIMKLLITHGANASAKASDGETPLHRAARNDHEQAARFLIRAGADLDAQDEHGWTPLHRAACGGYKGIVALLLDGGADVKCEGSRWALLYRAIKMDHMKLAEFLVEKGADVNAKEYDGRTMLHHAVLEGNVHKVSFLLENGATVDAVDEDGQTPLYFIYNSNDSLKIAELLLEKGANMYAECTDDGKTPLLNAVTEGRIAALSFLRRGVDPCIKTVRGKTLLDMTDDNDFKQKLLEEWRYRRATIAFSIQKAADPAIELLDPEQRRVPKLPGDMIWSILDEVYPGSKLEPKAEGPESV